MNGISDLIRRLKEKRARRVALQFPEGLKRQSAAMAVSLKNAGFEVIISGDPCYGACDLALDSLRYADVLVHFGHSPVDDRPEVIFEPYRMDFDSAVLENALPFMRGNRVVLVTTVQHVHLIPEMERFLQSKGVSCIISEGSGRAPNRGQVLGCSFSAAKADDVKEVLFVGTGLFHPKGIALATGAHVIACDPFTGSAQEVSGEALMRRRFAVIEKAKAAKSTGIIVSTKSGQERMDLAQRLKKLSPEAVIITLREVRPDELLNLGFGCYVNTACPRLAYDDQVRFPVPVLSPQEFEILCGVRSWEDYTIDEIE